MRRNIARIAFVLVFAGAAIVTGVEIGRQLQGHWSGGLGGGMGALALATGSRLFDWFWPKPKEGWAE